MEKGLIRAARDERATAGFRYFLLISLVAIAAILLVSGLGLRAILRDFVIMEAEDDAIRISAGIRDREMARFIRLTSDGRYELDIPKQELPELDREMRTFLGSFDIVKIKVFNTDTRIVYSTDPGIIGRLDPNNTKLATALGGTPISKHESKDSVWDLADEMRQDVEIVETYVPVSGPDGTVVGGFEIYKDVTHDLVTANMALIRSVSTLGITVLSVFTVLSCVMYQAVRTIRTGTTALRESEERFRGIVESTQAGYFRIDRDGRFQHVNEAWLRMHKYSTPDEVIGQHFSLTQVDQDLERAQKAVEELLAGEAIPSLEFARRCKGGAIGFHTFSAGPVVADGEVLGLEGFLIDTTDRKLAEKERQVLEAQIQHIQKLESLGVLAGGVAHDFNNLLAVIVNNAELITREPPGTRGIKKAVKEIKQASVRASELTNQMLVYAGKGRFTVEALSLNELLEETSRLLRVSISKKVDLKLNLADKLPPVDGDATQIRQVIMNLITNAGEAIGDNDGVITISTDVMVVAQRHVQEIYLGADLCEGRYVYLEVSDTGCGMAPETQAKVFDPFFTTHFAGRGLGLAAVLGIVQGHRGAVKVYSEPGKGATFTVLFPCSERKVELTSELQYAESVDRWRGTGMILVVDDEESFCSGIKMLLEDSGFTVLTAADGQEAIEVFREHTDEISVVLLDLIMPRMNGEKAFHELRRIKSDIDIILCSGYNQQEALGEFTDKGLAGFIKKPFEFEELIQKLRAILE